MRKYQQLLLLIISCFSVTVLFVYKSENTRLKYVLSVINFFGRNDAAILKLLHNYTSDEYRDVTKPLPVWQAIGESFHAYSAYWNRNELISGGEAVALVAGKRGAVVNFRCALSYDGNKRSIQGKFRFQRVGNGIEDASSDFTIYNFSCRLTRDFGHPESVDFTDLTLSYKTTYSIILKFYKRVGESFVKPQLCTACLDLVNNVSSKFAKNDTNILQFFLHHSKLGIEHFLVYNGDVLSSNLMKLLDRLNINVYLLPFNFPFSSNCSSCSERLRTIVETDCILRNAGYSRHTLLLASNEFFYASAKLQDEVPWTSKLQHSDTEATRLELTTFAVCVNPNQHKLLIDNTQYDPEVKPNNRLFIYRPYGQLAAKLTDPVQESVPLPLSAAFAHVYTECLHVGIDGLRNWRTSLRKDFIKHIEVVRDEISSMISYN